MRYQHLLIAALALACQATTDPTRSPTLSAQIGEPVQLHVGEAVDVSGLTIGFSAVVGESRCPTSVTCVWTGDAAVELFFRRMDEVTVDTLHTHLYPKAVTIDGIEIQLTSLAPYPAEPGTIPEGEYVVTLVTVAMQ